MTSLLRKERRVAPPPWAAGMRSSWQRDMWMSSGPTAVERRDPGHALGREDYCIGRGL